MNQINIKSNDLAKSRLIDEVFETCSITQRKCTCGMKKPLRACKGGSKTMKLKKPVQACHKLTKRI